MEIIEPIPYRTTREYRTVLREHLTKVCASTHEAVADSTIGYTANASNPAILDAKKSHACGFHNESQRRQWTTQI